MEQNYGTEDGLLVVKVDQIKYGYLATNEYCDDFDLTPLF